MNDKTSLAFYRELLTDIKARVRQAQTRTVLAANAEMILMYWDIGHLIAARLLQGGWGAGVIPRLAVDLKNELSEEKGFSETNLKRMLQVSQEYPALFSIGARPVPQLSNANQDIVADYEFTSPLPTEFRSSLPSIEAIEAELGGDE
jgi:hypothetical protein